MKGKGGDISLYKAEMYVCGRFRRFLMNSGDIPLVEYYYSLDKTKVDDVVFGSRLDVDKREIENRLIDVKGN